MELQRMSQGVIRGMAGATTPNLMDQVCGARDRDGAVLTVQRWSGFLGDRHAWVVTVNGAVTHHRAGRPDHVADYFRRSAATIGATPLTEDQARVRLGLFPALRCANCLHRLPIGGLYCTGCGTLRPQATAEAMSADLAVPEFAQDASRPRVGRASAHTQVIQPLSNLVVPAGIPVVAGHHRVVLGVNP
jgi:hypothetical protein